MILLSVTAGLSAAGLVWGAFVLRAGLKERHRLEARFHHAIGQLPDARLEPESNRVVFSSSRPVVVEASAHTQAGVGRVEETWISRVAGLAFAEVSTLELKPTLASMTGTLRTLEALRGSSPEAVVAASRDDGVERAFFALADRFSVRSLLLHRNGDLVLTVGRDGLSAQDARALGDLTAALAQALDEAATYARDAGARLLGGPERTAHALGSESGAPLAIPAETVRPRGT